MKLASDSQGEFFLKKAEEWIKNTKSSSAFFTDCKSVAKCAYAEALANTEGLTLYWWYEEQSEQE